MRYGVVVPARNEEQSIRASLATILGQTARPKIVVVVDDSSSDGTADAARKAGAVVVEIKRRSSASATGTPHLAYVINKGFEILEEERLDYVMVSGAECLYPKSYVETITSRMDKRVVLASGAAEGERIAPISPRGAGRLIRASWFRSAGFRYPLNYGFETWLVIKAFLDGFEARAYEDVKFRVLRRTGLSPRRAYLYGLGMRALGFTPHYTAVRAALLAASTRSLGSFLQLLVGYLSGRAKPYEKAVRRYTKRFEAKSLLSRLL